MAGPSFLSLQGNIAYTGNTTVSGGTLEFYNARASPTAMSPANTFNIASGAHAAVLHGQFRNHDR